MSFPRDGDDYLTMYPDLRRWINQCVACQSQGYKPSMPDEHTNLRKYFQPLSLNEAGLCEQCERVPKR